MSTGFWQRAGFLAIVIPLVVVATMTGGVALAQPAAASPAPESTPLPEPTPIPASRIPAQVVDVATLQRDVNAKTQPEGWVQEIANKLPDTRTEIDGLENEVRPLLAHDGPVNAVTDLSADLARVDERLTAWLDALKKRTDELGDTIEDLRTRRKVWELTLERASAEELPSVLVDQVRKAIEILRSTEATVFERRSQVLTVQAKVAEQHSRMNELSEGIAREVANRRSDVFRRDSLPLWSAFAEASKGIGLGDQVRASMRRNLDAINRHLKDRAWELVVEVAVLALFIMLFARLGRKARLWSQSDQSLRTTAALLDRPVASAVLVTMIVVGVPFRTTAPGAVNNLAGLVLLMAMVRLLPQMVRRSLRPAIVAFAVLVGLYLLLDLVPSAFLLDRLGELALAVLGCATCAWMLAHERGTGRSDQDRWSQAAVKVAQVAVVLFALSVIANLIGAVALSSLLAIATLASIYDAITLWLFSVVAMSAVTIALRTETSRRLPVVRHHDHRIRSALFKLFKIASVIAWLALVLDNFGLFDRTWRSLGTILKAELSFGGFTLSPSNILVFAVVVWISVKLARFISFVLDEEILPRVDLPKGVPATISKTTTYVVVTIGAVIAVAAAGLDLSKATIIVGALGVGIGFGLQNAVNNFVSGLILLFGRPINVGDRIEIGAVSGVVKDIGIRATVVRTWQGAEVIVPNATLISDNLVNWTLSDERRRMEIVVGVAYDSSPETVIELITDVARQHGDVLDDPEPETLFQDFGDNALMFELRAWTTGNFVTIASDLRLGIERALSEHGITIPFPQRVLHLDEAAAVLVAELGRNSQRATVSRAPEPAVSTGDDGKQPAAGASGSED